MVHLQQVTDEHKTEPQSGEKVCLKSVPGRVLSRSCVSWVQDESCLWDADSSFLSPRPWALTAAAAPKATLKFLATQLHPKTWLKRAAMGGTADEGGMVHGAGRGKVQQQKQHTSSAARRPRLLFWVN